MPRKGVPDRWLDYSNFGTTIDETRILALKVPLNRALLYSVSWDQRFSPDGAVCDLPDMQLVVDLTNTWRYYNPDSFIRQGVDYVKIATMGHELPSADVVQRFFAVLDSFFGNPKYRGVVGVHCTHGVNRTGYLICRYLIVRRKYSPASAIEAFGKARGHRLERENYLNDLKASDWPPMPEVADGVCDENVRIRLVPQPGASRKITSAECARGAAGSADRGDSSPLTIRGQDGASVTGAAGERDEQDPASLGASVTDVKRARLSSDGVIRLSSEADPLLHSVSRDAYSRPYCWLAQASICSGTESQRPSGRRQWSSSCTQRPPSGEKSWRKGIAFTGDSRLDNAGSRRGNVPVEGRGQRGYREVCSWRQERPCGDGDGRWYGAGLVGGGPPPHPRYDAPAGGRMRNGGWHFNGHMHPAARWRPCVPAERFPPLPGVLGTAPSRPFSPSEMQSRGFPSPPPRSWRY